MGLEGEEFVDANSGYHAGDKLSNGNYLAVGYMKAMHGLCIGCHEEAQKTLKKPHADLTICTNCHRFLPGLDSKAWDDQR